MNYTIFCSLTSLNVHLPKHVQFTEYITSESAGETFSNDIILRVIVWLVITPARVMHIRER